MLFLAVLFTLVHDERGSSLPGNECILACDEFLRILHDEMQAHKSNDSAVNEEMRGVIPLACAILVNRNGTLIIRTAFQIHNAADTIPALLALLQSQRTYRLCHCSYSLVGCDLTDRRWAGAAVWSDLQQETVLSPSPRSFSLRFVTPLLVTPQEAKPQHAYSLFPEPLTLFSCLQERWQAVGGPPTHISVAIAIEATRCVVASYHLCAKPYHTRDHLKPSHPGYKGSITYLCQRTEPEALALLHRLARLAFFTGCGYDTLSGWGMTRVDVS